MFVNPSLIIFEQKQIMVKNITIRQYLNIKYIEKVHNKCQRDTFKIHPIKIKPVKFKNHLPIEDKGQG